MNTVDNSKYLNSFEKIHQIMVEGKAVLDPDTAQLQNELLTAKMDINDLKSLLTSKNAELAKVLTIIQNSTKTSECQTVSKEFMGSYAAIKTKLVSEIRLLEGVRAAEGNLSINHFINFITAISDSLDLAVSAIKTCKSKSHLVEIIKQIEDIVETDTNLLQ